MSKGSAPRPFQVANEEYAMRWDLIFGRDNEKTNETQSLESTKPDRTRSDGGSDNPEGQTGQTQNA